MSLTGAASSCFVSPIATPMAADKARKYALKLANKGSMYVFLSLAAKQKAIRRGVKEVVKAIRKGSKGYPLFAFPQHRYHGRRRIACGCS